MNILIRPEQPTDYPSVFTLIEQAFRTMEYSDHREQYLVERLRRTDAFIPELSLVAELEGQVIAHILLSLIQIVDGDAVHPSLALAPVSVLPDYQHQGIGGQLIRVAHERARSLGHSSIALIGHAAYYPRFGYQPAHEYGIQFPFDVPPENAMVLELNPGALENVRGMIRYPSAFME